MFVHVGMVKTATTALQLDLFSRHSGLTYLGRPYQDENVGKAVDQLCFADSLSYDAESCRHVLRQSFEAARRLGKPIVLSNENIALHETCDRGLVAQRLKQVFPEASIIITLRRQQDLLPSWYFQKLDDLIRRDYYLSFHEWASEEALRRGGSIFEDLDYLQLLRGYREVFGASRLCVLLYEELAADPDAYMRRLCEFIGLDAREAQRLMADRHVHPRMSARFVTFGKLKTYGMPRGMSKLLRHTVPGPAQRAFGRWLDHGPRAKVRLPAQWHQLVSERHAEGNRRAAAEFGLNLQDHGYVV